MPIYEYRCRECGEQFESILLGASSPAPACPACGVGDPERLLSAPGAVGAAAGSDRLSCPNPTGGGCSPRSGFG